MGDRLQVEVAVLKMYNIVNKRLPSWQDPPSSSKIRVRPGLSRGSGRRQGAGAGRDHHDPEGVNTCQQILQQPAQLHQLMDAELTLAFHRFAGGVRAVRREQVRQPGSGERL